MIGLIERNAFRLSARDHAGGPCHYSVTQKRPSFMKRCNARKSNLQQSGDRFALAIDRRTSAEAGR